MRKGEQVWMRGYGGLEQLSYAPQDRPRPEPGEVVVEIVAAGVSHMDTFVREGAYRDRVERAFPSGQGTCFAGIVRAVGTGVATLRRGDAVLGHDPRHAAHATWVTVGAGAVLRKPDRLEWETAAGLYLTGATALTVVRRLHLHSGDVVAITAAAGGVGHVECQLARIAGATVIGLASPENHDYLRSIGVVPVSHGSGVEERLRSALDGRRLTAFIDNYGQAGELAAEFGVDAERLSTSADRGAIEAGLYNAGPDDADARAALLELVDLVTTRGLRPLTSRYFAFHHINEALAEMDNRKSRGKIILGMQPSGPEASYLEDRLRAHYARKDRPVDDLVG